MESVEPSALNTSDNNTNTTTVNVDLFLQNYQGICCNNNNNNNLKYMNNNKMVSTTMSGGLMPSAMTTTTTTSAAAGNIVQMDNTTQQQQQQIANINKCQHIVNKTSVTNVNQHLPHNNVAQTTTSINSPKMGSRRIFTPQFKLQVLESYRNDNDCKGNQRATARKYNIHRRQIQKWLQCESNLRSSVANINQSQVKHQFHNITPNTTATTTSVIATSPHNNTNQFVNQQHYQHQLKQQQQQHQQNMNSSITVPSSPTTTTPCTAAGVLVAANFAAAVAAAASVSMANVDKHCGTSTTSALSPIRPTAIVGAGGGDDGGGGGGMLHSHAHLPHLSHHLPPHHHHHHVHPHAHHHHPYSSLPYTHTAVPILSHHQSLYPHPAAAALLAAAHHHLPTHQLSTAGALHHHHHYQQQQQHEYHTFQQQQLFAAAAAVKTSAIEKEPLEVEVVGDADTESETEIGKNNNNKSPQSPKATKITKPANSTDYEREELGIENGHNNNCNRVRLTAVYKLQQQPLQQEEAAAEIPVHTSDIEQAAITPIDLSVTGARRHNNNNDSNEITMTIDETAQKYDKHVQNAAYNDVNIEDDDVVMGHNKNNNNCNQQYANNALVVDLTFRKRKVMLKHTTTTAQNVDASSTATEIKDEYTQPEKMPKFFAHQSSNTSVPSNGITETIKIKQEHMSTHDVSTSTTKSTTTANASQNITVKPVKLFKPYLLHEEEEEEQQQQDETKFHLTTIQNNNNAWQQQQQLPLAPLPLSISQHTIPTSELSTANTFQGATSTNDKYTFPIGSPYFQSAHGGSKPTSPKSVLCSPTSPIGFQCYSKGSPVSGYESSSSTYSECSSYRGLSQYSLDLQLRAVYSEQLGSPTHLHYSQKNQQQQLMVSVQQQHLHSWLDQDTQSSLATSSSRSSPTLTSTPTPTPPTTRTPPAANTSIALYA